MAKSSNRSSAKRPVSILASKAHYVVLCAVFVLTFAVVGTIIRAESHADIGSCTLYTWGLGARTSASGCVGELQNIVNEGNYFYQRNGINYIYPDGAYGTKTKAAVQAFQHHMGITADGVVGPVTWGKLCRIVQANHGSYYNVGCFNKSFRYHL